MRTDGSLSPSRKLCELRRGCIELDVLDVGSILVDVLFLKFGWKMIKLNFNYEFELTLPVENEIEFRRQKIVMRIKWSRIENNDKLQRNGANPGSKTRA